MASTKDRKIYWHEGFLDLNLSRGEFQLLSEATRKMEKEILAHRLNNKMEAATVEEKEDT